MKRTANCKVGVFACVFFCALVAALAAPETQPPYYTRIAKMASFISAGDPVGALETFDKTITGYATIAEDLQALAAQTEVLCSIDVVEDKEADDEKADVHHLDLDWYMTLKSRSDSGLVEPRRQRVAVTIQRFHAGSGRNARDSWRITSFSPVQILAPITIK